MRHRILRAYISLARGEHYTPSEIGAVVDFFRNGEIVESLPAAQLNWIENAELKKQVCEARGLTPEQFDKKLIFPKPSDVQNLVYSSELRRLFGVENLRFMPEFDKDGIFILPKARGFYVPTIKKGIVEDLKFYDYSILKRRAA